MKKDKRMYAFSYFFILRLVYNYVMNFKRKFPLFITILMLFSITGCKPDEFHRLQVNKQIIHAEIKEERLLYPLVPSEGMYFSELTGEELSVDIQDQRPIAVMVDNETLAYPHFGIANYGDIVYEMVNSAYNNRITRLMVLVKDYANIDQLGSIRSTRDTNVILQGEYNSILCHDGNSYTATPYFNNGYSSDHFSGTFSRVPNGKDYEFTEYIIPGDLDRNFESSGYSRTYNDYKPDVDSHFQFNKYEIESLTDESLETCSWITLPFWHNNSELEYDSEAQKYIYRCYGEVHVDAQDDKVLMFKNVIIQNVDMNVIDNQGHVLYDVVGSGSGYYLSNGHIIDMTWQKDSETDITRYYDANGEEIIFNRGKTYIGLIPSDTWSGVEIYD